MFTTMWPFGRPLYLRKGVPGLLISREKPFYIPSGATHIGVKRGTLRFFCPQNSMMPIPEGPFQSKSYWHYFPIPEGAQMCSFPNFSLGRYGEKGEFSGWSYGELVFNR